MKNKQKIEKKQKQIKVFQDLENPEDFQNFDAKYPKEINDLSVEDRSIARLKEDTLDFYNPFVTPVKLKEQNENASHSQVSLHSSQFEACRQEDDNESVNHCSPRNQSYRNMNEQSSLSKIKRAALRGIAPHGKRLLNFNILGNDRSTDPKQQFSTNRVRLTRYTLLSWAPLSLLYQFKRVSNLYFLLISILTYMPFSPKVSHLSIFEQTLKEDTYQQISSYIFQSPQSMVGTFAMVLFFTMLKEAYEDYQRYRLQREVNEKQGLVLGKFNRRLGFHQQFQRSKWQEMQTGQIIMIEKDQEVPADTLLLFTSNEQTGLAFVDTMALDGETNLKDKVSVLEDMSEDGDVHMSKFININGTLVYDNPNASLDNWEGYLTLNDEFKPISYKNFLLRGSILRNTKWAVGLLVYTGQDSKIFRNSKKPPHKVSNVMKLMNKMLLSVFFFQLFIVFLCAGLNFDWVKKQALKHPETGLTQQDLDEITSSFIQQILAFWVAFSHMIPISLYVAIEVLKLSQAMLVNKDVQMHDQGMLAECRNSELIEELGQVEMIFSDKTGTLTMNKMEFKKCSIKGVKYLEPEYDGQPTEELYDPLSLQMREEIAQSGKDPQAYTPILDFFQALSLCHTVVSDNGQYQASSPDELALVQGAAKLGIKFQQRNHNAIVIKNKYLKQQQTYTILAEFPFDSIRKCMSIMVRDENDKVLLLTKGADNVMLSKIDFDNSESNKELLDSVKEHLYNFSCEGYRTLVMAMRVISPQEYAKFQSIYKRIYESTSETKEFQLSNLYQKIERKLLYLGSTAIEDKLQDGVPETIENLIRADIRFVMLTGDKLETAKEIAKSCRIIEESTLTLELQLPSDQEFNVKTVRTMLKQKARDIRNQLAQNQQKGKQRSSKDRSLSTKRFDPKFMKLKDLKQEDLVLLVEGSILALILSTRDLEERFFQMSLIAKSVVCCRMSPKQKADVVAMFKKKGSWVSLSIGDGANDVPMILEANIGVGIRGKEGTQAVRSADFAISQFRFLQKLLLVHGRQGYIRVSKMICSYFYKNIVLVFAELPFIYYSHFSGQMFFLEWLPMLYNAIFTSWQCLFAFMFERDVNQAYAIRYPSTYKIGQESQLFTYSAFWKEIILAVWHGIVCFYVPVMGCGGFFPGAGDGKLQEHWFFSTISFALILHIVTCKLFIDSNFWNLLSLFSGLLGIALFYIFALAWSIPSVSDIFQPQLNGLMSSVLSDSRYYYLLIAVPMISLLPDFTFHAIQVIFYPRRQDQIMALQTMRGGVPPPLRHNLRLSVGLDQILKQTMKKSIDGELAVFNQEKAIKKVTVAYTGKDQHKAQLLGQKFRSALFQREEFLNLLGKKLDQPQAVQREQSSSRSTDESPNKVKDSQIKQQQYKSIVKKFDFVSLEKDDNDKQTNIKEELGNDLFNETQDMPNSFLEDTTSQLKDEQVIIASQLKAMPNLKILQSDKCSEAITQKNGNSEDQWLTYRNQQEQSASDNSVKERPKDMKGAISGQIGLKALQEPGQVRELFQGMQTPKANANTVVYIQSNNNNTPLNNVLAFNSGNILISMGSPLNSEALRERVSPDVLVNEGHPLEAVQTFHPNMVPKSRKKPQKMYVQKYRQIKENLYEVDKSHINDQL